MARLATFFGVLLIALGLAGYFAPDTFGKTGPEGKSATALIPVAFGAILFVCGALASAKPHLRKHAMHMAVVIGLIGAAGGFMPLVRSKMDFEMASAVTGLLMIVLCALFVILCIRSFVLARLARAEGFPDQPHEEENRVR